MAKRGDIKGEIVTEEQLERVAHIIGENSAARQALNDITRRRAIGEDPICILTTKRGYIVGDRKNFTVSPLGL